MLNDGIPGISETTMGVAIGRVDVSIVMVQVQINNLYKKCTLSKYSDVRKNNQNSGYP